MLTLIKGGRVINPGSLDAVLDILIKDDKIIDIVNNADNEKFNADKVIDASNKIVSPGFIDMHVHLREPGFEYKETIETGCMSAVYGGFTAICAMPNTNPVNDNKQITEYIIKKAIEANTARVYPIGAISKGQKGENLSEYGELKEAGAVALSDDGKPVKNSQLMRRALEYAKGLSLLIISHTEDIELAADGVMNEGIIATRLGLKGIPNAAESVMIMRDIALCELTASRLHIAHVSTAESVSVIREAKKRGIFVTAETAPHYFTLTEDEVIGYNTNAKMNPPLRTKKDQQAIIKGLYDGTIDVIATDHAPHSSIEKDVEFSLAANGIIGLETSIPLTLKLVEKGYISLNTLIEKMSINPAKILGIDNTLKIGNRADITIIDMDKSFIIDSNLFKSKSRNTPFDGMKVKGKAILTMVGGEIVYGDL